MEEYTKQGSVEAEMPEGRRKAGRPPSAKAATPVMKRAATPVVRRAATPVMRRAATPVMRRAATPRQRKSVEKQEVTPAVQKIQPEEAPVKRRGRPPRQKKDEDEPPTAMRRSAIPHRRKSGEEEQPVAPTVMRRSATPRKRKSGEGEPPAEQRMKPDEPTAAGLQHNGEVCISVDGVKMTATEVQQWIEKLQRRLDRSNKANESLLKEAVLVRAMRKELDKEKAANDRTAEEKRELQEKMEQLEEQAEAQRNRADTSNIWREKFVNSMEMCVSAQENTAAVQAHRDRVANRLVEMNADCTRMRADIKKLEAGKKAMAERQRAFKKYTPLMFQILDDLAPLAAGAHHVTRKRIDTLASEGIREKLLSACKEQRNEEDVMAAEVEKLITQGVTVPAQPKKEKKERPAPAPRRSGTMPNPKKKPDMTGPEETEKNILIQLAEKLKKKNEEGDTAEEPIIAGGTNTIHGKKTITVREQQETQLKEMSVKEKAAQMKKDATPQPRKEMSVREQLDMTPSPVKSNDDAGLAIDLDDDRLTIDLD